MARIKYSDLEFRDRSEIWHDKIALKEKYPLISWQWYPEYIIKLKFVFS